MKYFDSKVLVTMFAMLGLGACAPTADEPAPMDEATPAQTSTLLATVQQPDGTVTEFYEAATGHIVMSQLFSQSAVPTNSKALAHMTPTQAYNTLAPGVPVPQKLILAEQRAQALRAQAAASGAQRPATTGKGGPGPKNPSGSVAPLGAYSSSYFMSWAPGCPYHYDQGYYNWCWTDISGSWNYYADSADADYSVLCTDVGSATFKAVDSGSTQVNATVPAGSCRSYQSFVSTDPFDFADFSIHFYATGSGGSLFHFSGYLEW